MSGFVSQTGSYPSCCDTEQAPVNINLQLGNVFETQSNQLVSQINYTSNTLNNKINYTSNNIMNYINNINNFDIDNELIVGNDYNWNETVLEQLNTILFRYYYLTKNELRELKTKTTVSSYNPILNNGIYYPSYIYYQENIKKWFGYVGWNQSPDITKGGFKMVSNDTSATETAINISLLINFPDEYLFFGYNLDESSMPIITAWHTDNTRRTFRIIFGAKRLQNDTLQRFITVQYANFNNTTNTDANYNDVEINKYYLPTGMTFTETHFWSFNIWKEQFFIYCDGNLVFISPTITYTNPNNFVFIIKDLYLEDRNFNLNDGNQNRFQFADLYYFKERYLTDNEILNLSKYHLSQMTNTLRVYGTIECDRIITNQITDYDYTEKNFKDMVWKISQTSNLQNLLDSKENVMIFTPDRVIVSDPNSQTGKLTVSSITSNNLEDIQKLIREYNPVIEFIKDTFQSDIASFIESNPNIVTLGVSAGSALYTFLTGGLNSFNANNRIPRRYITQHQDSGGDLRIHYPNLTNDNNARIYISETFKDTYINNKQPTITGAATTITNNNLTPNKVLISDGYGKVATSNNIDLVKLSYLNNVDSDIQAQINNKQPNLTVSADSIVSVVNNIINTEWKKSGNDITYNTGNIIVDKNIEVDKIKIDTELKVCDPTLYCSNQYVRVIGNTVLNNANSINDYGILNPLLLSLTKRVVFQPDNMGNIKTKELVSNTTFNYGYADYLNGIYAGHVQNGSGNLYVYDQNISTYPLNTQSASVSFWCYSPIDMALYGEYRYIRIFQIDQDKLNILNYDRPKIRVLLGQGYNGLSGLYENIINVQYTYSSEGTWQSILDPPPTIGTSATKSGIDADLKIPRFYSFNFTYNSCSVFVNGVQIATNTVVLPQYEFRLENFFFPQSPHNSAYPALQNYRFWNVYMNYNRLYTADEVASLYRYETDNLMNTLKVNGIIRTTALATDTIYLKGQEFSLPSSYNQKQFYQQEQEAGKITIQDKTNNRRSLSIDTTEINTVTNIINNTGNSGFWYYSDANSDTAAQIKTIQIADVNNLSTTLSSKENAFTTLSVSKGGTGLSSLTNDLLLVGNGTGNVIQNANLRWDNTNNRLAIGGGNAPSYTLDVSGNIRATGLTASKLLLTDANKQLISSTTSISDTELGYLSGTSTNINTNFTNTSNWIGSLRDNKLNKSGFTVNSVLSTDASGHVIIHPTVDSTELGYLDGTTTNINTNFTNTSNWIGFLRDNKLNNTATANCVMITDASGNIIPSGTISTTELNYLDNTSKNIETNFTNTSNWIGFLRDNKEPSFTTLVVSKGGTGKSSITASRLLGCITAGQIDEITLGTNLSFSGTTLNATSSDTRWASSTGLIYLTSTTDRVGIGLVNPSSSYKLDVAGNINSSGTISASSFSGSGASITSLNADNISTGTLGVARGGTSLTSITANRLLGSGGTADTIQAISLAAPLTLSNGTLSLASDGWFQNTAGIVYNPQFIPIGNTTNVGIGKTDPVYRLEVVGDINITGSYRVNGTAFTGSGGSSQWISNGTMVYYNGGNVGIGVTNPSGLLELSSSTQALSRIILSGQEFYAAANTSTSGIAFLLGVNRTNNRQLWIGDSANLTQNALNSTFRINTGDNAGSGASIDSIATNGTTPLPLKLGTAGAITILANKNVGIGTANPNSPLSIFTASTSSSPDTNGIYLYNPDNAANKCAIIAARIGGSAANMALYSLDVAGSYGWSMKVNGNDTTNKCLRFNNSWNGGGTDRLVITDSGNLGINVTPNAQLQLSNTASYRKIVLYEVGNNDHQIVGLGANGGLTFQNPNTNDAFQWRAGTGTASSTELMRLTGGGNLGIGISPSAKLHVASGTYAPGTYTYGYLNQNGAGGQLTTTISAICAVFDSTIWCKGTVLSTSDVRIKKNIQDIDDDSALQKLLTIEPKIYNYIDEIERGTNKVYGFIAQQIKEVIPEAVSIQKEIIPNIYQLCEYTSNGIYFENTSNISFSSNLDIDIISQEGRQTYKVQEYSSNYIKLDKEIENTSNVFVYGTKVDDFCSLNKDYIFTLNVCATQELHRMIQRQEERIKQLENIILNYNSNI